MMITPRISHSNLGWVKVPVNHRAMDSGGFWIQHVSNRAHKKPDRIATIGLFVWRKSPGLIYGDNRAFPQRFFWYQAAIDGTHDSKCGKISSHRFWHSSWASSLARKSIKCMSDRTLADITQCCRTSNGIKLRACSSLNPWAIRLE